MMMITIHHTHVISLELTLIKMIEKMFYSGNGFPCMAESQVAFTKEKMCSIFFWLKFSFDKTLIQLNCLRRYQTQLPHHALACHNIEICNSSTILRLYQAEFVEHFSIPKSSPLHRLLNIILFSVELFSHPIMSKGLIIFTFREYPGGAQEGVYNSKTFLKVKAKF